ncbi:MAG: rhodanese-like domain-containing protein, partial [Alphaproteobacteria bacterium]
DVMAPDPSAEGLARAQACAAEVARRYGVRSLSLAGLDRLRRESADHSLYVLDVRSPAEYEAGHLPGAASAPGGQLVQETERWIATLGARVVLVDDTGVRATMTASWLLQMGWEEVFVLEGGIVGRTLTRGAWKPNLAGLQLDPRPPLRVEELRAMIDRDEALVIDLATSQDYIKGHIPGAWFAIRAELDEAVTRMPGTDVYVLTSPDNVLARLAAESLRQLTRKSVLTLEGGTRGWVAAGGALASGPERMASEARDVALKPYHHPDAIAQRMRDYLVWEVGLVAQIARDGDHRFRVGPLQNTAASVAEA